MPLCQAEPRAEPRAILIVEDDQSIGQLLVECLNEEGYRASWATDVASASELLATRRFALILTDALATGYTPADRWSNLEALRAAAAGTPTIICTARRESDFADWAARGFVALLPKPFDLEVLLALIARTLEQNRR